MDLPEIALTIDKLNEEFYIIQNENESLRKQNELLKKKYESYFDDDVEEAIIRCIKDPGSYYRMSHLLYLLYKDKFKCTSFKFKTWYYLDDKTNEWKLSQDSNILKKVISELENIFRVEKEKYKKNKIRLAWIFLFKKLCDDNYNDNDYTIRINESHYEGCNLIMNKLRDPIEKHKIMKDCTSEFFTCEDPKTTTRGTQTNRCNSILLPGNYRVISDL